MDALSIAGTREECVAKLKFKVAYADVRHVAAMVTDSSHSRLLSANRRPQVPTVCEQRRLMHERVMPALCAWQLESHEMLIQRRHDGIMN
jgi:5,10-methylenetetrahydromethanopterin reductase